jgi:riboflavin kinase / FMN adenylyltransferase
MRARRIHVGDASTRESLGSTACVLVIGNFDGVHRGHQAVLREAVAHARASGLTPCVLTFDPHPAAVVAGGAPPLLTTLEQRAELMGELGVERVYVRRFDTGFAAWKPEHFASQLVAGALEARFVVVGENFLFGAKRAGDLGLLRTLGSRLGFEVQVYAVASDAGGPFSSTRAREAIAAGDLEESARVLGRPHALTGVVVHGDERGRTLRFPTANLDRIAELLPPNGVYGVAVDRHDGGADAFFPLAHGLTNIGVRPTVDGTRLSIETHLLDFEGDLYGARLRVQLRTRLRDEKKFSSLDELKAQIARDVAEARHKLGPAGSH